MIINKHPGILNAELAKYETWEEFEKSEPNKCIKFNNGQTFQSAKGNKGVGQTTIKKFLGGNWKQWMVQDAFDFYTSPVQQLNCHITPFILVFSAFLFKVDIYTH